MTDILRAFAIAGRVAKTGKRDIEIIIIDGNLLRPGTVVACNDLRRALHIPVSNLYITKALVWQIIPIAAIASR
jgi:hypothetical protein